MPSSRLSRLAASVLVAATALTAQSPPVGFTYETLSLGALDGGTAMAFLPDGRLLLTERRTGNIRVFQDGQLQATPWATIAVGGGPPFYAESGLLGIAVDPGFLTNHHVYVYYTDPAHDQNRIARLTEVNGVGTNSRILTPEDAIPAILFHNGGAMVFGTDGTLFVATGDSTSSATAPDLGDWRGKILRFEVPNLTVPASNPFPGSPVWSFGHRNHFGLAIHPVSGELYQTENGAGSMDEVNRIVPGGNYGWPAYEGTETALDATTVDPLAVYAPTIAPTGTCFYHGTNYPPEYGDLWFFADYNWGALQTIRLDSSGTRPFAMGQFDDHPGAGYTVAMGPDGNLWFLTNDTIGFGADEIGRYVHDSEKLPSLHAMSVSNKTLGASLTAGIHAKHPGVAIAWVSLARFPVSVPTPWGDAWVLPDVVSPAFLIGNDNRGYHAWPVPNDPTLLNLTLYLQGACVSPAGDVRLTTASSLLVRG